MAPVYRVECCHFLVRSYHCFILLLVLLLTLFASVWMFDSTMLFFLLDSDIGKLLSCFKMSDKQTEWIENCRRQFCKTMKSKPDAVSGGGECAVFYWDLPAENYFSRHWGSCRFLPVHAENIMLIGKVHCLLLSLGTCDSKRAKGQRIPKHFYGLDWLYM